MTFGALAGWQAWAVIGGAAALAAALFLIRLRPPQVVVPSLLLWRRVLDESRELTLWERIRRAVSLVLTILIALALAMAAARPGRREAAGAAAGRLLIVLDASWSMQARTEGGETRWERAVAEARRILAGTGAGEIALATTADGLVEGPTRDAALIDAALDRAAPSGGDWGAWPRLAGAATVHFITDGARPRPTEPGAIVHSVFEPAANAAITAFELRPSLGGADAGDAYLEIANFAPSAQQVGLTLRRGRATVFERTLDVAPGEALRQVVPVARGGDPLLEARIEASSDALAIDDQASVWVERARPLQVVVAGADVGWLRTALGRNPDVAATFVDRPGFDRLPADQRRQADVLVFDGWAPAEPPARPALLVAPPAGTPWLNAPGDQALPGVPAPSGVEDRPRWEIPGDHPVVQGVDPFTLIISRAQVYSSPSLTPVARSARGTPLVLVHASAERRQIVLAFGAADSNLPAAPGFPVLLGNALDWLARPASRGRVEPGPLELDAGIDRLTGPGGREVPLTRIEGRTIAVIREPGLYVAEGGGSSSRFVVNAGSAQLSNLTRTSPVTAGQTRTVEAGTSTRPWWITLAIAALALALLEWWTWQRRITV